MTARLRIGAAGAAAALVFAAYFGLREYKTRQAEAEAAAGRLIDLPPLAELSRVEVFRLGVVPERIQFRRDTDGTWRLDQPETARASESALAGALDPLRDRRSLQAISDVTDRASFGLAAPSFSVLAEAADGRRIRLTIGRETPYGGRLYVALGDDPTIHVVEGGFQFALRRGVDDWRARNILPSFPEPATRVAFRTADAAWAITAAAGSWWGPAGEPLASGRVEPLLSRIRHMTVDGFLPPGVTVEAGGAALRVEGGGSAVELRFGTPAEGKGPVPVQGPDLGGTVSRYIYDSLWSPPAALTAPTDIEAELPMTVVDPHAGHDHD